MPLFTLQTAEQVEQGFQDYGATPGGKAMMRAEMRAAEEAIASKVYITWRSERSGADCARVSSESRCFCGLTLKEHASIDCRNPRAPACRASAGERDLRLRLLGSKQLFEVQPR